MSSYPGSPNYSPYQYGPGISEQKIPSQYSTGSSPPVSSTSSLQNPSRGYSASGYDWQGQSTQEDTRQLGNRWRYPSNQNPYSYSGPQSQRSGNESQTQHPVSFVSSTLPPPQHPHSLETPALHSLAYASQLESAGLKRQVQRSKTPISLPQHRMKSPAEMARSYPSGTLSSTASERSQSSQQHLTTSAIAALSSETGSQSYSSNYQLPASSAAYGQSTYAPVSNPSSSSQQVQAANQSPILQTNPTYSTQYARNQTTHANPREESARLSSSQRQHHYQQTPSTLTSTAYGTSKDPPAASNGHGTPARTSGEAAGGQSNQGSGTMSVTSPQASRTAIQRSHTQIANQYPSIPVDSLYNNSGSTQPLAEGTWDDRRFNRQATPPSTMPSFIDPTQVYNPYRQEYERMQAAKAEAEAEAETKRQQDAANEAPAASAQNQDTTTKHHPSTPNAETHGNPSLGHSPAVNSQQNTKKKRSRAPRKSAPAGSKTKTAQVNLTEENIDPLLRSDPQGQKGQTEKADDVMADEMKMMIEKMRQWRSKDPALFAKLWDDVRKGQASNGTTAPETPQQMAERATTPSTAPTALKSSAGQSKKKPRGSPAHLIDGLPDLGRFPAQRRRKTPKAKGIEPASYTEKTEGHQHQKASGAFSSEGHTAATSVDGDLPPQSPPANLTTPPAALPPAVEAPATRPAAPASTPGQPAQKPARQSTGGTVWPEDKRQVVAQALSQYLDTNPANKDHPSSAEEMLSLIDKNPSYIELCEQIESRGYAVNRGNLARFLLTSVPDLNSAPQAQQQHKPDPNSRVTPQAPPPPPPPPAPTHEVQPPQVPPSGQQSHMMVWKVKPSVVQTHTVTSPTTGAGYLAGHVPGPPPVPISSGKAERLGLPQPPLSVPAPFHKPPTATARASNMKKSKPTGPLPSAPPPGSKEAKAKKRLFSEIVDLSALSDDEDEVADRAAKEPRLVSSDPSHRPQSDVTVAKAPNHEHSPVPQQSQQDQSHPPQSNAEPASQADLSRFAMADDEVAKRDGLRHRTDIVKAINNAEALRRKYYNPKTIARDVLVAAGRHPTERPLNHHLQELQEIFSQVDYTSDMGTFRWDLVDPGGPPVPVVEPEDVLLLPPTFPLGVRSRGRPISASREVRDTASSDGPPAPNFTQRQHKPSNLSFSRSVHDAFPVKSETRKDATMAGTETPVPRRRGRPPGAKNKKPSKSTLRAAGAGSKIEVAIPVQSSPPTYSVYCCDWENCEAELHSLTTFERHLNKVHLPGTLTCAWLGCPAAKEPFMSSEELRQHLKATHVASLAWQLGDGPTVGRTVPMKRYLDDSVGSSITPPAPQAKKKAVGASSLVFPSSYTPIRAFNRVRGNASVQEKAREAFKAVEDRIVDIGIGLESAGCELATIERLWVVSPDEDHIRLKRPGRRSFHHRRLSYHHRH